MKKYISLTFFALIVVFSVSASNISKPVSAQYGFIENKGQIIDQNNKPNPQVLYLYNGNSLHVQLRKDGFSYEVMNMVKTPKTIINTEPIGKFATQADSFYITYQMHRVDINFKGGNKNAILKPFNAAKDYINYYTTATPEEGITHVHHFKKVLYENVYPNIDIEFVLNDSSNRGKFKYNFIVKPHANLADIQLEFIGANRTSLTKEGNILIETAYGNLEENIPLSYVVNKNNSHSTIKTSFISLDDNVFGISADEYNHNQTLVIDPVNWATYYGGSGNEVGNAIATDSDGNVVIAGYTNSSNGIATIGAHQTIFSNIGSGTEDAFIAKYNGNGARQWATYYGGSGTDYGYGVATDAIGDIITIGQTTSSSVITTTGAHQTIYGGSTDAFIAKLNSNGVRQWATYYGGNVYDSGRGIVTDITGNIIVTGYTTSTNDIATIGAHQTNYGGGTYDVLIAKFNSVGVRQWATYYGGSADDIGYGITIDANGNILVTGSTSSTNAIATNGAFQTQSAGGPTEAFIAKFNNNGVIQWATYFGGLGYDNGNGITTDVLGNVIITGYTSSANAITTLGVHQPAFGGNSDAFIAKFNNSGVRLWATYFGDSGNDSGVGIATDSSGSIIITGWTGTYMALPNYPIATVGAYQTTHGGGFYDAFIAKFNVNGLIQWGTYFGGSGFDYGFGIAIGTSGNIILIGESKSSNGIATINSQQTILGGNSDAFIAKFSPNGMLPIKLTAFNAVLENGKVNCTWETASEINNDYFNIERSADGDDFESISTVKGKGNSNTNTSYSFTDNNPFGGISYYRLKQTDFDGKYAYSRIQKVGSTDQSDTEIALYYKNYNPIVKVNSLIETKVVVELINLSGITVFTNKQPIALGENTFAINGNFVPGLYLLKVQLKNKVTVFKVWIR